MVLCTRFYHSPVSVESLPKTDKPPYLRVAGYLTVNLYSTTSVFFPSSAVA